MGTFSRAAQALGARLDRRGFLRRAAVAGSALTVAPLDFILRPGTAYAAICNCSGQTCDCGARCCDGYTEFCCTLTGRNECPPGTLLGGWWKVDGSGFCSGGPRYYLDCNARCGSCSCGSSGICSGSCSGTGCGCALGSCNNRKAGCTGFRYGQCNQAVACLGPIVCRLVTCAPPWLLDRTCGTTTRTDENTRFHDAPCLHNPVGQLQQVEPLPGSIRVAGWALDPDWVGAIDVHVYIDGQGFNIGPAVVSRPDVAAVYPAHGPFHGFDATIPWARPGPVEVCAYAINVNAGVANPVLGCTTVTASSSPFGSLDLVSEVLEGLHVVGWAIDPDTAGPVRVQARVANQTIDLGLADRARPDVAAAFPGLGSLHGFDVVVPWTSVGPVEVCIDVVNDGPGADQTVGCRTITVERAPVGGIDGAEPVPGGIRVRGWAIDPDSPLPVVVKVRLDAEEFAVGPAVLDRPDVALRHPGWGPAHGFDVTLPWNGRLPVRVCAFGVNIAPGTADGLLGCRPAI